MNPRFVPIFLSALIALAIGIVILFTRNSEPETGDSPKATPSATDDGPRIVVPPIENPGLTDELSKEHLNPDSIPGQAQPIFLSPEELLNEIGGALEKGEIERAARLIGEKGLTPVQKKRLHELSGKSGIQLHQKYPISEIGEIERNKLSRWTLNLRGDKLESIYFDLRYDPISKSWKVDSLALPSEKGQAPTSVSNDSLGIGNAFLKSALSLDFEKARTYVDSSKVSDAKIAGLCIIFEEAGYQLREKKPLRSVFNKETTAAFLANVETQSANQTAQFGITLQRADVSSPWKVTDIILDKLLSDYANRVAGGDVYYTPILKNPAGGDTLVIYFDFAEEVLSDRTRRQLTIVSSILRLDTTKSIKISGHTDAIGSDTYNQKLSSKRAIAVQDFLTKRGVLAQQIKILAEGESRPRRPETTTSGEDDPSGRRANRRTEIYLDF